MWLQQRSQQQQGTCHEHQRHQHSGVGSSNDDGANGCAKRADGGLLLKLVGIEIDPSWQGVACRNYQQVYGYGDDGSGSLVPKGCRRSGLVEASFVAEDFTSPTDGWTRDADLVLCHATVFSEDLMKATANACAACRPGTHFVLVSKPLVHPKIETLWKGQLDMSWGQATVYLQKRK